MANDGNIRIGIKITDTDRQIKNAEGKIELLNNKLKNLGSQKIPLQNKLQEIEQQMEANEAEYRKFQNMLSDGKLTGSEYQALGGIEGIEKNLTSLEHANDSLNAKADILQQKLNSINSKEKETNVKLSEQERLREELIQKQQQLNFEQAGGGKGLDDIGKKIKGITTKVIKWSLAVFSIRSAYTFVRQAMSTLTQYNEQMSTDIEYIRYALANMIKPIIEWIINAVYKILAYINYIAKAWFNVNLFENAGAEQFNKDLEKANGTAKELKKQLASFDVANVMSDTSDKKSGSGTKIPSFDLSDMKQIEIPDWVKWIAEHKDDIILLAEIVGIAFGTAKTTSILGNIAKIMGVAGAKGAIGGKGLAGLFTSLSSIAVIVAGLTIIYLCGKKVWDDLNKLGSEIDEITEKQKKYNKLWKENIDPKNLDQVKKLYTTQSINYQGAYDNLKKAKGVLGKIGDNAKSWAKSSLAVVENSEATATKMMEIYNLETTTKEEKEKILKYLQEQWKTNRDIMDQAVEYTDITKESMDAQAKINEYIVDMKKDLGYIEPQLYTYKDYLEGGKKAVETTYSVLDTIGKIAFHDKEFSIKVKVKDALSNIWEVLSSLSVFNSIEKNVVPSINTMANQFKRGYNTVKSLFAFDNGGIVLPQPGHGVPVGASAIMSERRAEAVIPFENPTAMEKIGQAIGRYVNIAIDNKMVVDGRVLASATNNQVNKERFLMNR